MAAPDFGAAGKLRATQIEDADDGVDEAKRAAANWAVSQLKNGMVVGLGSRSTATFAVAAIGQRVREGLRIIGIPTSENTFQQASRLGIPLSTLSSHPRIDVTIDGADEVELHSLNLIKGGGGNLLREKIVAVASTQLVIIVGQNKLVTQLGSRAPLAVEVAQFGWESTGMRLAALACKPVLRVAADQKYPSEQAHLDFLAVDKRGVYRLADQAAGVSRLTC